MSGKAISCVTLCSISHSDFIEDETPLSDSTAAVSDSVSVETKCIHLVQVCTSSN